MSDVRRKGNLAASLWSPLRPADGAPPPARPGGGVGLLAVLGPGLIAANAGDDAGGIAT